MAIFDQDFFDELTDKLASTGKVISEKAKEVTDSAKTSLQIAQEEKKLRAAYRQLGMYVYEKSEVKPDSKMASYYETITDLKETISKLKNTEKKTAKPAPEEVYESDDDEQEDRSFGEVVEDVVEEAAEAVEEFVENQAERVCPMCKSVVSAQLIYCPKCGEKLK